MADVLLTSTEEVIQLVSVSGASQGDITSAISAHNALATAHGLTTNISAALSGAASPSASNVFATLSSANVWTAGQTFQLDATIKSANADGDLGAIVFDGTGGATGAPWNITHLLEWPADRHDHSFNILYNARNSHAIGWTRNVNGEHCINFDLEARYVQSGDIVTYRGQIEWQIMYAPAGVGAPSWTRAPWQWYYQMDDGYAALQFGDDNDTDNSILLRNGYLDIDAANSISGGWGLRVAGGPAWFTGGVEIYDTQLRVRGAQTSVGAVYALWFDQTMTPATAGDAAALLISGSTIGAGSVNLSSVFGARIDLNSWTKGTSGDVTRTSALTLQRATFGNGNAALTFGNGADIANPGFANYNIYQINTDPNYFAGLINTGSAFQVDSVQVVGNRVVDARADDTVNDTTWDATTAGVLDALRDAMITHGLIAAA